MGFPARTCRARGSVHLIGVRRALDCQRTQGWGPPRRRRAGAHALDDRTVPRHPAGPDASIMCYQLPGRSPGIGRPIVGGADITAERPGCRREDLPEGHGRLVGLPLDLGGPLLVQLLARRVGDDGVGQQCAVGVQLAAEPAQVLDVGLVCLDGGLDRVAYPVTPVIRPACTVGMTCTSETRVGKSNAITRPMRSRRSIRTAHSRTIRKVSSSGTNPPHPDSASMACACDG